MRLFPCYRNLLIFFQKEIPYGLPPLRGIEHQMNFIPGASLLNRPAYWPSLEEAKEIKGKLMSSCEMDL